jgi:hypothetical protein
MAMNKAVSERAKPRATEIGFSRDFSGAPRTPPPSCRRPYRSPFF